MRIYGRRPLTRLEAGLYAAIGAVLLTLVATRMLFYMEAAERATMEATVMQLMAAGTTRLAYGVMRGQVEDLAAWRKRNPFDVAGVSPANFAGEIDLVHPRALERGSWAFDRERTELIYLPRLRTGLETSDPEGALRFRVEISANGMRYMLVPTPAYTWE